MELEKRIESGSGKKRESGAIRRLSGFTLVELIVVITILAILATIGFLALSGYTQDAKDSAIKANVRSLQTAIVSEAAVTNNSTRYYVVHDSAYALSWAFAYVDWTGVALTWGDVGSAPADSNYTAGKPDFKKLKLNPEKFRISSSGFPGGTLGVLARATGFGAYSAEASYDANSLMAAGADFTVSANGKKRSVSYVQAAGISPITKIASVAGNFPSSGMPAGYVSWILRGDPGSASNLTGALMDGELKKESSVLTCPAGQGISDGACVAAYVGGTAKTGADIKTWWDSQSNRAIQIGPSTSCPMYKFDKIGAFAFSWTSGCSVSWWSTTNSYYSNDCGTTWTKLTKTGCDTINGIVGQTTSNNGSWHMSVNYGWSPWYACTDVNQHISGGNLCKPQWGGTHEVWVNWFMW